MVFARAYMLGFFDGFQSPYELSSGVTWEDDQHATDAYDTGANHGQIIGAAVRFHPTLAQPWNIKGGR